MIKILCLGDSLTNGARDEYFRDYPLELNNIISKKKKFLVYVLMRVLTVKLAQK